MCVWERGRESTQVETRELVIFLPIHIMDAHTKENTHHSHTCLFIVMIIAATRRLTLRSMARLWIQDCAMLVLCEHDRQKITCKECMMLSPGPGASPCFALTHRHVSWASTQRAHTRTYILTYSLCLFDFKPVHLAHRRSHSLAQSAPKNGRRACDPARIAGCRRGAAVRARPLIEVAL